MASWLDILKNDAGACEYAELYCQHINDVFKDMGNRGSHRFKQEFIEKALFEFFDEVIRYSRRKIPRIRVVKDLALLARVLSKNGRIRGQQALSVTAADLLTGKLVSGYTVKGTSVRWNRSALGTSEIERSAHSSACVARKSTLLFPDNLEAATAKYDRFAIPRADNHSLANRAMPVRLPPHIIDAVDHCRDPRTGEVQFSDLRERLTPAELILLRRAARKTSEMAALAFGVERIGGNYRPLTLANYGGRPPLTNFGLKLLEACFKRDADQRLLSTCNGEIELARFDKLVESLVQGFQTANDIRQQHAGLNRRRLDLLVGYPVGRETSGYDERRDHELPFEEEERRENKQSRAARHLFAALVQKYESFFVIKLINRFLDYYDHQIQERRDRQSINDSYELFLNVTFPQFRAWERELENQLKDGIVRSNGTLHSYERHPRVSGTAIEVPLVPKDILALPMPLAYRAGRGVFAQPEHELVEFLIDVLFEGRPQLCKACQSSWHHLTNFFPPENLEVLSAEFRKGNR